jgi:type IX secretion system PorP/SprF family membrane protein
MIKRFTIAFCLVIIFLGAKAQQDPYYSHFMLNKLAYNPGVAGYKNAICANVLAHRQWVGYQDGSLEYKTPGGQSLQRRAVGPQTYFGSVTMPIEALKGGIGLVFMNDAVGYERTINVKFSYAYKREFDYKNQVLQIGLDAGMLQKEFDGTYYNPRQPNDPLIPLASTSGRKFDLGFGAFYNNYKLNNLEIGVSATHLTGGTVTYEALAQQRKVAIVPNIYIVASQSYPIGGIILQPNIWVKTVFSTTQFDLNCRAVIQQQYVAGLTYRDGGNSKFLDAFSLQLGYYLQPDFYIGYAYDVPITRGLAGGGTHEIFATYCFKIDKPVPTIRYRIDQRRLGGYR